MIEKGKEKTNCFIKYLQWVKKVSDFKDIKSSKVKELDRFSQSIFTMVEKIDNLISPRMKNLDRVFQNIFIMVERNFKL